MNRSAGACECLAQNFRKVCRGKDFAFLTWGPDDIPMLKENFHVNGIESEWLSTTYDLQVIFNRQTDGGNKQRSLEYAMEHFEIPQNLPAHDALNDAYFTALVAQKLNVPEGVRTYSQFRGEFLESGVIGDADAGEDGYVTIGEMLNDDLVANPKCPLCGEPLVNQDKMLHSKGQRYTFHYKCKKDGDMLLSLKLHRNFNETWRAKRTVAEAGENELRDFREALERANVRRKTRQRKRGAPRRVRTEKEQ